MLCCAWRRSAAIYTFLAGVGMQAGILKQGKYLYFPREISMEFLGKCDVGHGLYIERGWRSYLLCGEGRWRGSGRGCVILIDKFCAGKQSKQKPASYRHISCQVIIILPFLFVITAHSFMHSFSCNSIVSVMSNERHLSYYVCLQSVCNFVI